MVASTRTPLRAGRLRSLNQPRPVEVRADSATGAPLALRQSRHGHSGAEWQRVSVAERWRLDDTWWRQPLERHYYAVTLPHGARLTLFRDALTGDWWVQG